jgi:hypothetical protein
VTLTAPPPSSTSEADEPKPRPFVITETVEWRVDATSEDDALARFKHDPDAGMLWTILGTVVRPA